MCRVRGKLLQSLGASTKITTSPTFGTTNAANTLSVPHTPPSRSSITSSGDLLSNWSWTTAELSRPGEDPALLTEALISTSPQKIDPLLFSLDSQLLIAGQEQLVEADQSWAAWEEVIASLHDDETGRADMFLS